MFDLVNGIPVHPLVVHVVAVMLPLAVLGTIAIVVRRSWTMTYGWLVVAVTAVATIACPIASSSGEALEKRVGDPGEHAELGGTLVWFALALLVFVTAYVVLVRRREQGSSQIGFAALPTVVAGLAIVAALASGVQVYRVGDSGAKAVWSDQVSSAPAQ